MHDDVIKWSHFPRCWPFVQGIHRSPVNSAHKGQWRLALMLSLIWAWLNGWVNNGGAGDLRRHRAHYDVTVMDQRVLRGASFIFFNITVTVTWASRRLKSPANWLFINSLFKLSTKDTAQFCITDSLVMRIHWWPRDRGPAMSLLPDT